MTWGGEREARGESRSSWDGERKEKKNRGGEMQQDRMGLRKKIFSVFLRVCFFSFNQRNTFVAMNVWKQSFSKWSTNCSGIKNTEIIGDKKKGTLTWDCKVKKAMLLQFCFKGKHTVSVLNTKAGLFLMDCWAVLQTWWHHRAEASCVVHTVKVQRS